MQSSLVSPHLRHQFPAKGVEYPTSRFRFRPSAIFTQRREVVESLEEWAGHSILPLLKPVEKCWQPQDFLPNPSSDSDSFQDALRALRAAAAEQPDEYFLVLAGDMITEDGLPTYQSFVNRLEGVEDETGTSASSWAVWTRSWTAEENRHGDLLNKYLYLTGRVDMKMVERTLQYLVGAGMDPGVEGDPYKGFVYTSFQERATFISHSNTARLAKKHGDVTLAKICGTIASDEKRHEMAYIKVVEKLLEVDPNGVVLAIEEMMRKTIIMPAHLMGDGRDPRLFNHFSAAAQKLGVYTTKDYADILEFLVGRWKLEKVEGLSGPAREAQDYVCGLANRMRKVQERIDSRSKGGKPYKLRSSWIFDREICLY